MSIAITQHSPLFATAPQCAAADMLMVADAGFKTVVNNRPDGEGGPEQPLSAEVGQAAQDLGMHYVYIPFASANLTPEITAEFARALGDAPKPVFCFCRSGARSSMVFEAAVQMGLLDPADLTYIGA